MHKFLDALPNTPCTQIPDINFCTVCIRINRDVATQCPYSSRIEQIEITETTKPAPLENVPKFEQYPLIEITKTISPRLPTEYKRTIDSDAIIVEPVEMPVASEFVKKRVKTIATKPTSITKVEKPPTPQQKPIIKVKKVKKKEQEVLPTQPKDNVEIPVTKEPVKTDAKIMAAKPVPVPKSEKSHIPPQRVILKAKTVKTKE